jgi:hypothetical protein
MTGEANETTRECIAKVETETGARTRTRHFSMALVNFCLDAFLLATLALYGWLTAMLRLVFPAPTASIGWTLWGWTFDQWWDFQFNTLCLFALAVLFHVMLHWNWVCSVIANQIFQLRKRPNDSVQTVYGVGTLIVLLHLIVGGIVAALYCVHRPTQ